MLGLVSSDRQLLKDTVRTLQLLAKASTISASAKVNFNTVQSSVGKLRKDIAAARGELNLTRQGNALHSMDATAILGMKQLLKELEFIKTRTWEARKGLSRKHEAERLQNMRARGLMRALNASGAGQEGGVDEKSVQTSQSLRDKLAILVDNFARAQEELEEQGLQLTEHLQTREVLNAGAPEGSSGAQPKDEKTKTLERSVGALRQQVAKAQSELVLFQAAYKKHIGEVVAQEAEARKETLLSASADADFSRLLDTFLDIKREMRADQALQNELSQISKEAAAAERQVAKRYESVTGAGVEQMKKQALENVHRLYASREQAIQMQWERDRLRAHYLETVFRHRVQMERFQDHLFFVFRNYRSHFTDMKIESEARYRELVGNAVRDSLRLSQDNIALRQKILAVPDNSGSGSGSAGNSSSAVGSATNDTKTQAGHAIDAKTEE